MTLDLSLLRAPELIEPLSFEVVLASIRADLAIRLPEIAPSLQIESTVVSKVLQAFAYRETLLRGRVNDAGRAVMMAFAVNGDLDHLAALYGVTRRVITPASGGLPAVLENNLEFRRRVLLAMEAFAAAGPLGAYVFHALSADPRVLNADVWSPAAGEVSVAIQSRTGNGEATDELIAAVRAHLSRDDVKPLTDVLTVRSVVNHPFSVSLDAYVMPGPDPIVVKTAIEAAIVAASTARRTPSRDMPRSALVGAAQLPVVERVSLVSPSTDIAMGYGEVPTLESLNVRVHAHE